MAITATITVLSKWSAQPLTPKSFVPGAEVRASAHTRGIETERRLSDPQDDPVQYSTIELGGRIDLRIDPS